MKQLDLFQWADNRPSNVVDALPSILRRIRILKAYQVPRRESEGQLIEVATWRERSVA